MSDDISRPTASAKFWFDGAQNSFDTAMSERIRMDKTTPGRNADIALASGLKGLALGLGDLSVGLRATYILLEQINRKLSK